MIEFADKFKKVTDGRLFDVVLMDPPWALSTKNPSRGVSIPYPSLKDQ